MLTQLLAGLAVIIAVGFLGWAWRKRKTPRERWRELWPLAGGLGLALVALIVENADQGNFTLAEYVLLAGALVLLIAGGMLALLERRPLAQARGTWGVLSGGLLLLLTVALPVLGARFALDDEIATRGTPTAGPTQSMNTVARGVYDRVLAVISVETGYDPDMISERLDSGEASVAQMVRETDGDLEVVIEGITAVMNDEVRALVAADRIDEGAASLAISSMETAVRIGVEVDLTGLMQRFDSSDQDAAQ